MRIDLFGDSFGMSGAAKGAVDIHSIRLGDEKMDHFIPKNRNVIWTAHTFMLSYSCDGLKTVAATLS